MKKSILLFLGAICIASSLFAQQRTATYFQKVYNAVPINNDTAIFIFNSIARAANGDYGILATYQSRTNAGDMAIIRTDSLGVVKWVTNFASDTTEAGTGIRATPDGGFVISGSTIPPFNPLLGEMVMTKVDANGNIRWGNQYGLADDYEIASDLAVLNNGNIMLVGEGPAVPGGVLLGYFIITRSDGSPEDGRFVRFGNAPAPIKAIDKTTDGGAILAGQTGLFTQSTFNDACLVKINAQGAVQWGKRYNLEGVQFCSTVLAASDGGYVLAGQGTFQRGPGERQRGFYIYKTRNDGTLQWAKSYARPNNIFSFVKSSIELNDGYLMMGYTTVGIDTLRYRTPSGNDTIVLRDRNNLMAMKTNFNGDVLWAKTYGDSLRTIGVPDEMGVTKSHSGGFALVSEYYGAGLLSRGGGLLVHADPNGNIGNATNCQIRNLSYVVFSHTPTDSSNVNVTEAGEEVPNNLRRGTFNLQVATLCSGTGIHTNTADNRLPDAAVQVYPNPTQGDLFIEFDKDLVGEAAKTRIELLDLTGRLIYQQETHQENIKITPPQYAKGFYFLKIERAGKFLVKKIVVE
jgi:hypothetical protein